MRTKLIVDSLRFYRYLMVVISLCVCAFYSTSIVATPAVIPNCTVAGESLYPGLIQTTYDTTGYNTYPYNHAQYNTLITNYATPSNLFGSGVAAQVNGSGNPFGSDDNYLTIFSGFIEAPVTGSYGIGVDGDDAIEVIIDGVVITGWYGGHGRAGSAQFTVNVDLDVGYHTIEFRHQERGGGDNYYLYWRPPGDANYSIVPTTNLSSCQPDPVYLPAVPPACAAPLPELQLSTYDTTGYGTYPVDHATYNTLVANYAIDANLFGSGTIATVNGSGNPYGVDEDYLAIFTGYIYAPTTGTYVFGVDGDDAVEVLLDGQVMSGYYGAHAAAGSPQDTVNVNLSSGYHTVEFRHQERGGLDSYHLYWQRPGDTSLGIVSSTSLSYCSVETTITLMKTVVTISDSINTVSNPKAIPGATARYTLVATNYGPNTASNTLLEDNLDTLITTEQKISWVSNSIFVSAPSLYGGTNTNLSDAVDGDEGEFTDTSGNRLLKVNCSTLLSGQSCTVTFDVLIN